MLCMLSSRWGSVLRSVRPLTHARRSNLRCLQTTKTIQHPDIHDANGATKGSTLLTSDDTQTNIRGNQGVESANLYKVSPTASNLQDIDHEQVIERIARASELRKEQPLEEGEYEADFDLAQSFAAVEVLDDLLRKGKHPSKQALESLVTIACTAHDDQQIARLQSLYEAYWLHMSRTSIDLIGKHYCRFDAFEQCIDFYEKQMRHGRTVSREAWTELLTALLDKNETTVALELLQKIEDFSKRGGIVTLPQRLYYDALTAFANAYHASGLQWTWHRAIRSKGLQRIDLGTCTKVMNACGRCGLPVLATDVLKYLASLEISPKSFHYSALIDSYCVAGDVKNAFNILDIMRREGMDPSPTTASAILNFMSTDLDLIDRAFFTLQDIKAAGGNIDISAFNSVIDASVLRRDVSRAVATYQEHENLGVVPDVHTLNSLITGCVGSYQKELAISMIKVFREKHLVGANAQTYAGLISVCILQEDYEDAFTYLEEMKSEGHQPSVEIYSLIIRRCVSQNDPRGKVAYDEMKGWGYRDRHIQDLFNGRGRAIRPHVTERNSGIYNHLLTMSESKRYFAPKA